MPDHVALLNGAPADAISVLDRGLQFGDGVFETLAVADGRVRLWPRHWARLARSCAALALPVPQEADVLAECRRLCAGHGRAVVKLIVTRGPGGRGYALPETIRASRLLLRRPWPRREPEDYRRGVTVRVCVRRLGGSSLAGHKHLNRLEQVLARAEWDDLAIAEGLMLNGADEVVEATAANVFCIEDGHLTTPDLSRAGVAGVMRAAVLDAAPRIGIQATVEPLPLRRLLAADEVFLTNAVSGILPVARCGEARFAAPRIAARLSRALAPEGVTPCG